MDHFNSERDLPLAHQFEIGQHDLNMHYWDDFKTQCCVIGHDPCISLVQAVEVFAQLAVDDVTDRAEMTVNSIIDNLLNVLSMALSLHRERNTSTSTSGSCRPDYSLGEIMKGEDKTLMNYQEGVVGHDPVLDLIDKTPFAEWNSAFGENIPFIFAYTSVSSTQGVMFTLGVIDRNTQQFVPLHATLNISLDVNRPTIMALVFKVLPYVKALHQEFVSKYKVLGNFEVVRKSDHPPCTKTIRYVVKGRTRVFEKKWKFGSNVNCDQFYVRMTQIFERIADRVVFRVHPDLSFKLEDAVSVKGFFLPFGAPTAIRTFAEALRCAREISNIVAVLIEQGVVHHDITLDNVMQTTNGSYFLVDYDDAAVVDGNGQCPAIPFDRLSPTKHCTDTYKSHGHEVDLWAIGSLLIDMKLTDGRRQEVVQLGERIRNEYKTLSIQDVQEILARAGTREAKTK